jgi:hypothetical protein
MATMPAGRYYVGDLCYVMHDVWDEVCDLMFPYSNTSAFGKFTLKDGREFAVWSTAYGDGSYPDQVGRVYDVDAGVIGCILESDIRDPEGFTSGGQVIDFATEFETWEDRGMIRFGDISIDTAGNFYDDEDEYDWGEEEEVPAY